MTPEQTLDWLAQQHFDQCREDRPVQHWIRKMKSELPEQGPECARCKDLEDMSKLTRDQAAIIGLYTGVSAGPFEDVQKLAEDLLERPVFTHELANQNLCEKLKELVKPQFIQLCAEKNT